MDKKLVAMQGPFNTRSGYGDHARSIFYALHESDKYEIVIIDVRWGDTPRNFLQSDNPQHKKLLNCVLNKPLDRQPDIYFDIRIPNEFQTIGKYNIGITAGIETTAVSQAWIEGCNKMDLVIVPSEHARSGFVNTVYDKINNLPDGSTQKVGQVKATTPIEVLFEGVDDDIIKPLTIDQMDKSFLDMLNDKVKEKFAFLFVGQWIKGGFGEDRKDIFKTIKIFSETFANLKNPPALILKTSGATFSILDKVEVQGKINGVRNGFPKDWILPPVYLLHGDLSEREMNELYNHPKIKCMISFTHGEGFGRPMLEASMVDLPVICSAWSGPMDFLTKEESILVDGKVQQIPDSAVWENILIKESGWFVIDDHQAFSALKYATENVNMIKDKAKQLGKKNRSKFTLDGMAQLLNKIMDARTQHIAQPVSLNLPKLKKVT
jgi:glycosyltransferase involved in cell wall biosynthesis|tara:strand:+ start:936 stop:2240 length:1305 start_codon:yes stop_codon:yes gene_type:complete